MAELRTPPLALAFSNFGVARAAEAIDEIGHNLLALGGARLRHHRIGPLRAHTWSKRKTGNENDKGDMDWFQPHKTEPPFTLMTSPVMKLAKSEATKRMGPAISSGVAARPRGITEVAILWPAFVSSTGLDMSVATQPGATQLTRILWRASSVESPFVKLMTPPLLAP